MQYDVGCQPLSTTLADYLIPTSTEVPAMELRYNETPTSLNPLGVKGVGESGTIPVAAALIAAVEDALAPFGVRIDQAPVSPVRLAEAVRAAGGQQRAA
jgi:aerobic carbon-monoxide dehydrogenase large subunit